jgi:WD40 repeat protein
MKHLTIMLFLTILLVGSFSPVMAQDGREPITPANVTQVTQLATFGRGQVIKAGWSPDNRFLAVAGIRGLWLYDTGNLEAEPILLDVFGEWVYQFAFSPDGSTLATSGGDGQLRLWTIDPATRAITLLATIVARDKPVVRIVFSPDGRRLATSDGYSVHVWNVADITHSEPQSFFPLADPDSLRLAISLILDIGFSADSSRIVALSGQTGIVWGDITTGEEHVFLTVEELVEKSSLPAGPATLMALDPSGAKMAVGLFGGQILILDINSGELVDLIDTFGNLAALAFSLDGTRLVYAWASFYTGTAYEVKVWDVETGREVTSLKHDAVVQSLAFSPGGTGLVTIENFSVRLWDMLTYQEIPFAHEHSGPFWTLAFSPDGTQLATGSRDNTARIYETETGELVQILRGHVGPVLDIAYSPDGLLLATASQDRSIRLWYTVTYAETSVFEGHGDDVLRIAFDTTGTELASGAWDNTVRLWDIARHGEARVLWELDQSEKALFPEVITGLVYSPDGRWLAAAAADMYDTASEHEVIIWDAKTKDQVALLSYRGGTSGLAFSPDSSMLAISTIETDESVDSVSAMLSSLEEREPVEITNTIRLWDVETQTAREFIQLVTLDTGISGLVFSPDGSLLAAIDTQTIRIWDVETGTELAVLEVDTRPFTDLAFNAQGTLLASSGEDGAIRLWGVP